MSEPQLRQPARATLVPTGTVSVPPTPRFEAESFFSLDNPDVRICYIGDLFARRFLDIVERPQSGMRLAYYDRKEIPECNGENRVRVGLAKVAALMGGQPNGGAGALLTNGCSNVLRILDVEAVLAEVRVNWVTRSGWRVGLGPGLVDFPYEWSGPQRVFELAELALYLQ